MHIVIYWSLELKVEALELQGVGPTACSKMHVD